jgi:hypothetical protein
MKIPTRDWIGITLLGLSAISAQALVWFGPWKGTLVSSDTSSSGGVLAFSAEYQLHWPWWIYLVLLGTAGTGILLLILPGRRKATA